MGHACSHSKEKVFHPTHKTTVSPKSKREVCIKPSPNKRDMGYSRCYTNKALSIPLSQRIQSESAMNILIIAGVTVLVYMTVWFLISLRLGRNDVADIAYGGGFIVAAFTAIVHAGGLTARASLVTSLVILWGLRLLLHIGVRNRGKAEDPRYRKWREEWGRYATIRAFAQVFLLQGILIVVISIPVIFVNTAGRTPWTVLDVLGTMVWITGIVFEAVGDYQLARFKREPANKGQIMRTGLWNYTRHPNYFGEVTLWWGIYLIALSLPWGWITIIGPLTITFLILKVSGIPLLERRYEGNAEFEEYRRRTSAFFPMPPKKGPVG